jgi:transposase
MSWESLVAIKVLETARPMRRSACGHPSGPAAVWPREQAGHTTASNDSRRSDHSLLASWGPSTHDRKDARGIAQLLRMGWFRPVHCKSPPAQEVRALLAGRKLLQGKLLDVELSIRGILRGFGLKVGVVSKGGFAARIRELVAGQAMLERVIEPMLRAREALRTEYHALHRAVLGIVRDDGTCRRLMTVPGVGALVAITFTSAVDDPGRFTRSRTVGAHFGLTPKKYQSGETDVTGGISKVGDAMVRSVLYEAANVMLTRAGRFSTLKCWAMAVAGRRGMKRAKVALARKLATVLHRMWVDGSSFRFGKEVAAG